MNIFSVGANTVVQPPPTVNITFEEITENLKEPGLFTVNISWSHPIGMYKYTLS